ncbi:MAG: hypothetical protein PUH39_04030 [Bacteroidales bacterium]|nr:hypothetical protein [Bacteroidales bacterium]
MKKRIILIVFMLGVISLGNANNTVTVTEDKLTVRANTDNSNEKTNVAESIFADISGHKLTVAFSQNLGEVSIDISTASGATISCLSVQTPTGYQYFVQNAGSYVITFTLPNGDKYYGEFEVTD